MCTRPAGYISSGQAIRQEVPDKHLYGIAFAEFVIYLEQTHAEKEIAPVFKMAHLARLQM